MRNRAVRLFGRAYRRLYLPRVETIPDVRTDTFVSSLRDEIRQAGTDSLIHFGNGYAFEGGLGLQQNPDEFAALCAFLYRRRPHHVYVEIGSASGGACLFLYRKLGFDQVVSIDDGGHPRALEQDANFAQIPGIRRHVGDSHAPNAATFLERELAGPIDVAFVDGDHSYSGVRRDIDLVRRFLRPGGLLVLHDTVASSGVERAWLWCIRADDLRPVAEFVGTDRPLGIGVAERR